MNSNGSFPLATLYAQATNSTAATFGLLLIIFLSLVPCLIGTFLTVGRTWWALARDNAVPFSPFFARVNTRLSCPVQATVFTAVLTCAFGAITLGSKTGFQDITGSFIVLSTTSYALAFAPNVLTRRRYMPRGDFHMGRAGAYVEACAVLFIVFFNIMFCFRKSIPLRELDCLCGRVLTPLSSARVPDDVRVDELQLRDPRRRRLHHRHLVGGAWPAQVRGPEAVRAV